MTSEGLAPAEATHRRELQGLQFVRANAALLVVLSHSFGTLALPEYFGFEYAGGVFDKGGVGVDIFFVLSGFIIVYVSLVETSLSPRLGAVDFLLKRFVRIVPFLWVVVAAYAVVRYLGANEFTPVEYLNSLFLIPVGEVAPEVVWTLRHEALFYIVFAVALLLRRRAPWLLALWCVAPVVVWVLSLAGVGPPEPELAGFVFSKYNAFFGCGVLVGVGFQCYNTSRRDVIRSAPLAWALIIAGSTLAFVAQGSWGNAAVAIASTLTVTAGVLAPTSRNAFTRLWELLGDASYAIYLTHTIVLSVLATAWIAVLGRAAYPFAVLASIGFSVIVGIAAHRYVEKPVIRYSRRAVERLRRRPVPKS